MRVQKQKQMVFIYLIGLISLVSFACLRLEALNCPDLVETSEIQSQFQILQYAGASISLKQKEVVKELLHKNSKSLNLFSCYFSLGSDPQKLSDVLSAVKLQILNLRYAVYTQESKVQRVSLQNLRKMSGHFLKEPSLMGRRLGSSVRSLVLDEMERLVQMNPELVRDELNRGVWRMDITKGIQLEIESQWDGVKTQIPKSATPTSLSRYFGFRSWRPAMAYRSKLVRLLSKFKMSQEESLEAQLHELFKLNQTNVDLIETERVLKHYLGVSLKELSNNSYFLIKPWLDPVIDEKVRVLKSELGVSWPLIAPLVGVNIDGDFKEINEPIELLDAMRLGQARSHYGRVKNPIGRLYEIVFLKRLTQMWTQLDVVQLRSDLNRITSLNTLLAVQDYQKKFARWPASVNELMKNHLINELPKDHFTGESLKYNSDRQQIWSVGENGIDEKGQGDDISLRLSR